MTMQIDHAPYAPAFDIVADAEVRCVSPVAIVALNLGLTVAAVVLASVAGAGIFASLMLGWIGGGVLTLAMLFGLFGGDDRADAQPAAFAPSAGGPGRGEDPDRRRATLLAEWEADRQADMQADVNAAAHTAAAPTHAIFRRLTRAFRARRPGAVVTGFTHLG